MRRTWFWLVQVPVWIVDGFWFLYTRLLAALAIATLVGTLMALTLWFGFGIRWGW